MCAERCCLSEYLSCIKLAFSLKFLRGFSTRNHDENTASTRNGAGYH